MSNAESASKKARRDAAREHAREMREAAARKKKRNRLFVQGGVILGALAIAGVVLLVVTNLTRPPSPGPLNMLSDGIVLTGDGTSMSYEKTDAIAAGAEPVASTPSTDAGVVSIVMYTDYQCPICQQFETTNGDQLETWVTQGVATLEIHPIAILDSQSLGARYSSRSTNAAACVANFEPDKFWAVNRAFYADQPAEQTAGLTNAEITTLVADAGAKTSEVADCIANETFKTWVADSSERTRGPVPNSDLEAVGGTPTVLVNGQQYTGGITDAAAFTAFVNAIGASTQGEPETDPEG
jgi:protein-disulfide isomerase